MKFKLPQISRLSVLPVRSLARRIEMRLAGLATAIAEGFSGQSASGFTLLSNAEELPNEVLIGCSNEMDLTAHDGWALISPYGEWPHTQGMQVFQKSDAQAIVDHFQSTWNRVKRAIVGLPIFKGHPDDPAFANVHKDKTEYGQFAELQARDDGLWGKPVLSNDGADLVLNNGLKFLSPRWFVAPDKSRGAQPAWRPRVLASVGLTNRPNIPGKSLVNQQPTIMDLKQLIALLALANSATEADVITAITSLKNRPESSALANESAAKTAAEGEVTKLNGRVTELTTAFANERKAHATSLAAQAVRDGRIVDADRETWVRRLERDFTTESTALANMKPTVKTQAVTAGLGSRTTEKTGDRGNVAKITDLVSARVRTGETYDRAFANVKADPANKSLFEPAEA